MAAANAKNEAVNRCVKTHLGAGDNAQIADTLHSTLFHPKLQAYSTRVFGDAFLEEAQVGRVLVQGMRSVAEQVSTTKNKGMLTRTCRSLLSTLLMCAANDENKVNIL